MDFGEVQKALKFFRVFLLLQVACKKFFTLNSKKIKKNIEVVMSHYVVLDILALSANLASTIKLYHLEKMGLNVYHVILLLL